MKFIQLKPSDDLHDKIKKLAKENGVNIPTFCLNIIQRHIFYKEYKEKECTSTITE